VAALQHRDILQCHVLAELEADRLVAHAYQAALLAREPLAVDQARARDRDILQSDAPDERIFPVAVAEILVFVVLVRLGLVVTLALGGEGGYDLCPLFEVEVDVALEANRVAGILAGGEVDRATAGCGGLLDGAVNGGRVDGHAIGFGAVVLHIVHLGLGHRCREAENQQ